MSTALAFTTGEAATAAETPQTPTPEESTPVIELLAPMRGPASSTSQTEPSTKMPIITTERAPSCASSAAE